MFRNCSYLFKRSIERRLLNDCFQSEPLLLRHKWQWALLCHFVLTQLGNKMSLIFPMVMMMKKMCGDCSEQETRQISLHFPIFFQFWFEVSSSPKHGFRGRGSVCSVFIYGYSATGTNFYHRWLTCIAQLLKAASKMRSLAHLYSVPFN